MEVDIVPVVVCMVVVPVVWDRSFGDLGKVAVVLERVVGVVGMVEGFEDPLVSTQN